MTRVTELVSRQRAVTADTALRLARCFGTTAEFWLNLQAKYDLAVAENEKGAQIGREVISLRDAAGN